MKRLSKLIVLVFVFAVIFILSACGGKDKNDNEKNSKIDNNSSTSQTQEAETATIPFQNNISDATDFSEGKAFIKTQDSQKFIVIDIKGKELFSLNDNQKPYTNFVNDVFILSNIYQTSQGQRYFPDTLINANSEILASPEKQGYTRFCVDEDLVNSVTDPRLLADGYVLAYLRTENYEGLKIELGVLNTKGEWIVPLSADNPISKYFAENSTNLEPEYAYLGDGVVVFTPSFGITEFYNVKDNYWFQLDLPYKNMNFENGVTVASSLRHVYRVTNRGEKTELTGDGLDNIGSSDIGKYSSGLFYYNNCFYNNAGIKEIDLSKYTLYKSDYFPAFNGSNAIIGIINSAGSYYYTVIDKTGNFLFEPIEIRYPQGMSTPPTEDIMSYSENIYIYRSLLLDDPNGTDFIFLDEQGNKKFTLPSLVNDRNIYVYRYSNGLIKVTNYYTEERYYLNTSGTRVIG